MIVDQVVARMYLCESPFERSDAGLEERDVFNGVLGLLHYILRRAQEVWDAQTYLRRLLLDDTIRPGLFA